MKNKIEEKWLLRARIRQEIRMEKLMYELDGKDWYSFEELKKEVMK